MALGINTSGGILQQQDSLVGTCSDLCFDWSKFQQFRVDVVNLLELLSFGETVELSWLIRSRNYVTIFLIILKISVLEIFEVLKYEMIKPLANSFF